MNDVVIIRSGGDIASGIAHRLYKCGFKVIIIEIEKPLVIRRSISFADSISKGKKEVEGVVAKHIKRYDEIDGIWKNKEIPVIIDEGCTILNYIKPLAVVDAILAKKNIGTHIDMAPITIGVGPGFEAGVDVNLVVETNRGQTLGQVIHSGKAQENTGIPGNIIGYTTERVIKSPCDGVLTIKEDIGNMVYKGDVVCYVGDEPVKTVISGVVRGMISDNSNVFKGLKIADVDPRGKTEYCDIISDKARAVAGGVVEAIMYMKNRVLGDEL
ncbi:selenium-dependent molybdenum cofactor biosynthesis protein YqeB [Tepidibacter hydrothermalis]|uniref:Selenium-dependent molybdenum cofactor biosynthesis protein YqeB n=1 Tax=Tepidibacter hydrothermalis TaxID=3036126 RepID=A0ABY8EH54_9FIRM|nr:selenium-dependent molybdenum cofactor biosynthesis protein YqeB [Tepidibacter hydrothermalis]WFD12278.1 selenium-dependent molybdenum cofactor biosynthesis protein YqeB [Tepidibacter hydrothermalis]